MNDTLKEIMDIEKYDAEATASQTKQNLYSAIIEVYNDFDLYEMMSIFEDASKDINRGNLSGKGFEIDIRITDHKTLIEKGKL